MKGAKAKCAHVWNVVSTRKLSDGRVEERLQCAKCGARGVETSKRK